MWRHGGRTWEAIVKTMLSPRVRQIAVGRREQKSNIAQCSFNVINSDGYRGQVERGWAGAEAQK